MPRCAPASVSIRRRALAAATLALAAVGLGAAAPAAAQVPRAFPQNALRGIVLFGVPPAVRLNGQPAELAPGVRIHGQDNMLKMSAALAGTQFLVNYVREARTGLVLEVWLLRDDEAARQPWPVTPEQAATWAFDPVGQYWVRP